MNKKLKITTACISTFSCFGLMPTLRWQDNSNNLIQSKFSDETKLTNGSNYTGTLTIWNPGLICYAGQAQKYLSFEDRTYSVNINTIFYSDYNDFVKEFLRQITNLNSVADIENVRISENKIEFTTLANIYSKCNYFELSIPNPVLHRHTEFKFDFNNGNDLAIFEIHLNHSLNDVAKRYSEVLATKQAYIKVDEDNTIQGFKKNYLSLSVRSDYLKGLILSAINFNAFNKILTDQKYASINEHEDFKKILNYLKEGKLFDINHKLSNKIVIDDELKDETKNVRYWLDKVLLNESIETIHNPIRWLSNSKYINKYKISTNNNDVCFSMDELLLNRRLMLEIYWSTENKNGIETAFFYYDYDLKEFVINGSNHIKIKAPIQNEEQNYISIDKIKLIDTSFGGKFLIDELNVCNANNELFILSTKNYKHDFDFKINKLINVRKDLNNKYWLELFKRYIDDVESGLDNPEILNKSKKFKSIITDFSTKYSPIQVLDDELNKYLRQDKSYSIADNNLIKNLINDYEIKAYNSVDGIEISMNFYDYNSLGEIKSDKLINKTIRYSFSNNKYYEPTYTNVIRSKVTTKETLSDDAEQMILDKFIGYENNTDNKLISTKLSKNDWITNALNSIEIIENNKFGIKGVINYNEKSYVHNFLNNQINQSSNSFNFEIEYQEEHSNTNKIPNENKDVIPENDLTILWVAIGVVAAVIIIFSIAGFYFTKKRKQISDDNINDQVN